MSGESGKERRARNLKPARRECEKGGKRRKADLGNLGTARELEPMDYDAPGTTVRETGV